MANPDSAFGSIISSVFSLSTPAAGSPDAAFADVIGTNASTTATPSSPFAALDEWENASDRAISRYRNWLAANMIKWLGDWIASPAEKHDLDAIKGPFAQHVGEHLVAALPAIPIEAAVEIAEREIVIRRLIIDPAASLLAEETAHVLGGIAGFIIVAIVETAILHVISKTDEQVVIGYTADQISQLVTGTINPIVDARQQEARRLLRALRTALAERDLPESEWRRIRQETSESIRLIDESQKDPADLRLYRMMALMSGVYRGTSVPADATSPVTLPAVDHDLAFTMEHVEVQGQTPIDTFSDGSLIIVRFEAEERLRQLADGEVMVADGPRPPGEFSVTLFQKGTIADTDISVPRVYQVGGEQYGVWFNLPRGTYYLRIERSDDHPIGLAAQGKYWVKAGV